MADDNYVSPDYLGPMLDANIANILDKLQNSNYTPEGFDNLNSLLAENQQAKDNLMGPPGWAAADPEAVKATLDNPDIPTNVKRNAVSAGYATPELRDEYAKRLGAIPQQTQAAKAKLQQDTDILASIFGGQQQTVQQKAQNDAALIREQQLREAKKANEYSHLLSAKELNMSDIDSLVNTSAVDQLQRHKQMMELRKSINQDLSANFLEDPIGWIFGQLSAPAKIKQHNAIVGEYNATDDYITSQSKAAEAVRNANAGKMASMTEAEARLLAENKLLDAQKDIAEIEKGKINLGDKFRKEGQALDDRATTALGLAIDRADKDADRDANRKIAEENAKLRQMQYEDIAEGRRLRRAQEEEKMQIKRDAAQEQADRDALVANALGKYNITSEKQFNKLPPKEKERMGQLLKSYDETKGYGFYGATPVDVLTNVAAVKTKSGELNDAQQVLVKAMYQLQEKGSREAMTVPKEQRADVVNSSIKKNVKIWLDNPTTAGPPDGEGGINKIFDLPSLSFMAQQPSLGGNKAALKVAELEASLPKGTQITHQMLVTALASDIDPKAGNITPIAKQLAEFYKKGLDEAVNPRLQLDRLGLEPMTKFNVPLPTGYFGGKTNYNVASVAGATVALAKTMIDKSRDPDQIMALSKIAESGGK